MSTLVEQARGYMEGNKMSQAKFAALVGMGDSSLSLWLKGTYPNPEALEKKVRVFLEKEELREAADGGMQTSFARTGISERVLQTLEYCRIQKSIGVVYGDAGVGKTFTSRFWAKDKPDVIMVTATPTFAAPKPLLKLLARSLKANRQGCVDDIYMDLLDKLEGSDKVIVIDEAQHLNRGALEIVRSINDATGTAVVLIGNEVVYSKMLGKQQAEFAQLFSRLGMRSHVMTDLFRPEDVEAVFGDSLHEKEAKYLLQICRSRYGLRGAVYVWQNAKNNEDVSIDGIRAMAGVMGITV